MSKRKHWKFNIAIKDIHFFFCIYDNRPWYFFRCRFFFLFGWTFAWHFLGCVHRIFSLSRCCVRKKFFYASPRICSWFQNREEPMAYFEKRFCSFLALQKVTNLFGFLSRCFFGFARQELSFGFLPSSLPFCFFLQYVFSYFWVWGVSSNFLKI